MILVDSREPPEIQAELVKEFNAQVAPLSYGDVLVILENGKTLAIERKTPDDFLNSIRDGRLFSQVERMASADFSIVVVTGVLRYDGDTVISERRRTGWNGASVRHAILAVQFAGCPITSCSEDNYARTIREIIATVSKSHEQKPKRAITFPPLSPDVEFFTALPGVSVERAKSLVKFCKEKGAKTIAECLVILSALPIMSDKPPLWGYKTIDDVRQWLGLPDKVFFDVREYE